MQHGRPQRAFDWDELWSSSPPSPEMVRGGRRMASRVVRFARARGLKVRSLADFGCGPAVTLFSLACSQRDWALWGFDASRAVLAADRRRAAREGLPNMRFAYARLPDVPTRRFDVVLCIATLHYLKNPRAALRRLFRAVEPGGCLIFNYPNEATRRWYARAARTDPSLARRFPSLLAGENLLSFQGVDALLGRRPENFWRAVGERAPAANPCAVVMR